MYTDIEKLLCNVMGRSDCNWAWSIWKKYTRYDGYCWTTLNGMILEHIFVSQTHIYCSPFELIFTNKKKHSHAHSNLPWLLTMHDIWPLSKWTRNTRHTNSYTHTHFNSLKMQKEIGAVSFDITLRFTLSICTCQWCWWFWFRLSIRSLLSHNFLHYFTIFTVGMLGFWSYA